MVVWSYGVSLQSQILTYIQKKDKERGEQKRLKKQNEDDKDKAATTQLQRCCGLSALKY